MQRKGDLSKGEESRAGSGGWGGEGSKKRRGGGTKKVACYDVQKRDFLLNLLRLTGVPQEGRRCI